MAWTNKEKRYDYDTAIDRKIEKINETKDNKKEDIQTEENLSDEKVETCSFKMPISRKQKLIKHLKNRGLTFSSGLRNIIYEYMKNQKL